MTTPVRITPNGPHAIGCILLNHYYSTERERYALIGALLAGKSPGHLFTLTTLMRNDKGRRQLGVKFHDAVDKLALWAQPVDCLLVFCALPGIEHYARTRLLRRVVHLGMALVDCQVYRDQFSGMVLTIDERDILLEALGSPALVDRLTRTATQGPPLHLATG